MKINILLALAFLLFSCKNENKPLWLSGLWEGTFKDAYTSNDSTKHFADQPAYPIVLTYKVSDNSGNVLYPTLGCSSTWGYLFTENDTLFFEEKIVSNDNKIGCIDKMQYKALKLNEDEIIVFGNGINSDGVRILTEGKLKKGVKTNADFVKGKLDEKAEGKVQKISNKKSHLVSQALDISTSMPIVGVWQNHEVTEKYGIESSITIIWEFKSNFTSMLRVRTGSGYKSGNTSTWKMVGQILQTKSGDNEPEEYTIIWDDDKFNGFTTMAEGSMGNRHFVKIPNNPFANDRNTESVNTGSTTEKKNSMTCPRCNGSGYHACSLPPLSAEDTKCRTQQEFANCMTTNNADKAQVTCCRCNGTGIWRY